MRIATFAAALGLTLGIMGPSAAEQSKAKTHTVTIEDMRFQPAVLVVAPGDTVVWINKDLVAHTATSPVGGFDSKVILASTCGDTPSRRRRATSSTSVRSIRP